MDNKAFDIMYHEHLLYYRIETLDRLLNMHGLELFDIDMAPDIHGGSMVAYACHVGARQKTERLSTAIFKEFYRSHTIDTYKSFAAEIQNLRDNIYEFVDGLKANKNIYAFGAPAKGTVLLNYCGLTNEQITCATEKNLLKFGKFIPGTGIPIVDEDEQDEPDYYLLLSWNFAKHFCKSKAFLSGKRKFIVPIPQPEILSV